MAIIKKISIKNSAGTGYDSRDIGAEAENIAVSYDSANKITDVSNASSTKNLKEALTEIETIAESAAPKNHASQTSEYGVASANKYGHVKVGRGLSANDGQLSLDFATDNEIDENKPVRSSDSRLNNTSGIEQSLTFSDGLTTPTTIIYDGKTAQTIKYDNVGAAPTSHASSSTTYGVASTSNYGHVKPGAGLDISTENPGIIYVKYGSDANTACQGNDSRLSNSRTPTSHATTSTTYGAGDASNYGHVKLSDSYNNKEENVMAANSVGASAYALQNAYYNLTNKTSQTIIFTCNSTTGYLSIFKIGSVVCLRISFSTNFTSKGIKQLVLIPDEYRQSINQLRWSIPSFNSSDSTVVESMLQYNTENHYLYLAPGKINQKLDYHVSVTYLQ